MGAEETGDRLRALVTGCYLAFGTYYLYWRIGTLNPDAPLFSWLLWGAEAFGFLTAAVHAHTLARLTDPKPLPAPEGLKVDVFVTTLNEPTDLIRHTLLACRRMDYPHTTWLLDDGNDPAKRALAESLGCRYLARGRNEHYKAGNLNHGLKHAEGDLVAVFDADHAPRRDFLVRTLGFFRDNGVAFVQTPQDFYNLDSYQHRNSGDRPLIGAEQALFFRVIQRGKDRSNAAFFCGSGAVLRVAALEAIGGFATGTVTEDLHTSIRLHKRGYRSVYYAESLAYGLAPQSARAFLAQRLRWGQGAFQVWRREPVLFSGQLTWSQKLNYLASLTTFLDGWVKLVLYVAPMVVLVTGVLPLKALNSEFFLRFVPMYLLSFLAYSEMSRGYGRPWLTETFNMARYATFARSVVTGWRRHRRFVVTSKRETGQGEMSQVWPQMAIAVGSCVSAVVGVLLWWRTRHLSDIALTMNLLWAGLNAGLAGAVVKFAAGRRHRRREYRFPLPVPVRMMVGGGESVLCLATSLSTGGCGLISEVALGAPGQRKGHLVLPAGAVRFSCALRAYFPPQAGRQRETPPEPGRPSRAKHKYGMTLTPDSEEDALRLEHFLYGTDYQWQVLGLHEHRATVVGWLIARWRGEPRQAIRSPKEWLPAVYTADEGGERMAVLSRHDWHRELAHATLATEVQVGQCLDFRVYGQASRTRLSGEIMAVRRSDTGEAPLWTVRLAMMHDGKPLLGASAASSAVTTAMSLLLALACALGASKVRAEASWAQWLAGVETDTRHGQYGYAGLVLPLGVAGLPGRAGWFQRYWLDWLAYEYPVGPGVVSARAPGGHAGIGRSFSFSGGGFEFLGGLQYRKTDLTPRQAGASVQESDWLGFAGFGWDRPFDAFGRSWHFQGLSHLTTLPGWWFRGRLGPTGGLLGGEAIFQGDDDYSAWRAGAYWVLPRIADGAEVTVKFGAGATEGLDRSLYGGIEFSRALRYEGRTLPGRARDVK